ncbi:uncharacterized protein LOC121866737 [Homarus americanus]|uniref:uncharacterized protein LOC121866737 n=1 Tax=Homarus americanus TaxID=6706 RepID=UPI001C48B513|nr:uncharacterized protein LOC121866737 [Homarus americanus]
MLVRQIVASVTLAVLLVAWTAGACWPGYVEQAAEQADLVLTAKVTYLGSRSGNNRNKVYDLVRIQAKEFLKGDVLYQDYLRTLTEGLPEEEATMLEDPLDGISDLPQQGSLTLDNTLGVGGVTDHGTCSGRVRVGDVQIFFLRIKTKDEVRKGHRDATFQVTSQPIKINLDVLRLTKAAVQGTLGIENIVIQGLLFTCIETQRCDKE